MTQERRRLDQKWVRAKDMQRGVIYGGTPAGEFQIDETGKIWWKRVDGTIWRVNPDPDDTFYIIKECE